MPSKSATRQVRTRPMTVAKRKTLATEQLKRALAAEDKDAAITAALEIMVEELTLNAELDERLRERYAELEALNASKPKPAKAPTPVPIAGPDLDHFNPYAKPDPYKLLEWYGHNQFRAGVAGATLQVLGELVDAVQSREPGTRPASRRGKKSMVDFVVEHVAGPDY